MNAFFLLTQQLKKWMSCFLSIWAGIRPINYNDNSCMTNVKNEGRLCMQKMWAHFDDPFWPLRTLCFVFTGLMLEEEDYLDLSG